MKRFFIFALMFAILPGLVLAQDDRDRHDRGDGNHQGHVNNHVNRGNVVRPRANVRPAVHAGVSAQFRGLGVHSYPKPYARTQLLMTNPQRSAIAFPNRGPGGVSIHANVFARTNFSGNPVIRAHMGIITGGAFRAQIVGFNASERIVGHYYWHTGAGFNYCHYYDRWGYHWYGWYLGNSYFWTRWYNNNYWWYDPVLFRWCYWHDGGWWWQDPDTTTVYVYNNGSYAPIDGGASVNVNVNTGNGNGPGAYNSQPIQNQGGKNAFYSNDGSREVKLVGNDAFLYDTSGQNSFKPIYLGSNVTGVKFSNTNNGKPLQIMLMLSDGSFDVYDGQGNSLSGGDSSSGYNQAPGQSNSYNNGGSQPLDTGNSNPPASGSNNPPPVPSGT